MRQTQGRQNDDILHLASLVNKEKNKRIVQERKKILPSGEFDEKLVENTPKELSANEASVHL